MPSLFRLILVNTAVAILIMVVAATFMTNPRPERFLWPFVISMVYSSTIGTLSWWIMPKAAPRIKGGGVQYWLTFLAILTGIGWAGGSAAYLFLRFQPFVNTDMEYARSILICIIFTLAIGSISGVVEMARHRVQASSLQLRTQELERERALKAAADAKLQSLESRIHPHFLFNTLNSISALVRSNPSQAEEMIERLATLLRFSLDRHGSLVTLADEIKITTDYLEIEKTRFGDRLRYSFDIEDDLLLTQVPALSIQTLAENSVKYAVGVQRQSTELRIGARRDGKLVRFEVRDSGPGFSPESLPKGHGLDTLQQRLEAFFGDQAVLSARRLEPGMEVAFRVPC